MIIGLGTDIVDIERIRAIHARFGERFYRRILSPRELAEMPPTSAAFIGSRFAAKEAASKALGTGFSRGILPTLLEVKKVASGQPLLILHGAALARACELGMRRAHLSLSHERNLAIATVILED